MICKNCGCENSESNTYCDVCGAELDKSKTESANKNSKTINKSTRALNKNTIIIIVLVVAIVIVSIVTAITLNFILADNTSNDSTSFDVQTTQSTESSAVSEISTTKAKTETTKPTTTTKKKANNKFFINKYYLAYDDISGLMIYAYEILDNYSVRVSYFEEPDFTKRTNVFTFYAQKSGNRIYNDEMEFEFLLDFENKTVKFKDEHRDKYERLKEVDNLSGKTILSYKKEIKM